MNACPHCGCVIEGMVPEEDLNNAEKDLRVMRTKVTRLETDARKRAEQHKHYEDAMEVLEYWKECCAPRTRELNGKRLSHCLARFDGGYDKLLLKRSVYGYSRRPYVTEHGRQEQGARGQRHVDARLIFSDAEHVDKGLEIAAEYEAENPKSPLEELWDAIR